MISSGKLVVLGPLKKGLNIFASGACIVARKTFAPASFLCLCWVWLFLAQGLAVLFRRDSVFASLVVPSATGGSWSSRMMHAFMRTGTNSFF